MNNLSCINPHAQIGSNVMIGNYCTIHENVIIGDDTVIEDYSTLGYPTPLAKEKSLIIGKNSLIRSYSLFYQGSEFGDGLVTGHRVTVRENTFAGEHLQIGTLSDIQGNCRVGNYVRLHSNVHIGQESRIHDFVWIYPYVVLTNDRLPPSDGPYEGPEIHEFSIIATMSCILPAVKVFKGSLVGAHSLVTKDVEAETVVVGVPAKRLFKTSEIKHSDLSIGSAYPWTKHFHRGYPSEVVAEWQKGNYYYSPYGRSENG